MLSNYLINQYRELKGHSVNRRGTTESLLSIHGMDEGLRSGKFKSQTRNAHSISHLAPENYQSQVKDLSNPEKAKLEVAASLFLNELNNITNILNMNLTQGLDPMLRVDAQHQNKFFPSLTQALSTLIDNLVNDLNACELDLDLLADPNAVAAVAKSSGRSTNVLGNLISGARGLKKLSPAERLSYWARKSIDAQYYNKASHSDNTKNRKGLSEAYDALLNKPGERDNDAELSSWVLNFGAEMALEVLKSTKALRELHERYVTYMLTRPRSGHEQDAVNQASCVDQVNSDSPVPEEQAELQSEFVTKFDELNKRVVIFESVKSLISKSGEKFFYRLSPGSALDASIVWNTYDDNCKLAGLIDDGPLSLQDTSSRYEAKLGALCSAHEVTNWARILA